MATDPYKYFRVEAQDLLEGLTQGALELEKGAADRAMVGSLLRLAHTLKGAARVVRQPAVAELAHGVEDILSPFRDTGTTVPQDLAPEMLHLLDQIGAGLAALDHPSGDTAAPAAGQPSRAALMSLRASRTWSGRAGNTPLRVRGGEVVVCSHMRVSCMPDVISPR